MGIPRNLRVSIYYFYYFYLTSTISILLLLSEIIITTFNNNGPYLFRYLQNHCGNLLGEFLLKDLFRFDLIKNVHLFIFFFLLLLLFFTNIIRLFGNLASTWCVPWKRYWRGFLHQHSSYLPWLYSRYHPCSLHCKYCLFSGPCYYLNLLICLSITN